MILIPAAVSSLFLHSVSASGYEGEYNMKAAIHLSRADMMLGDGLLKDAERELRMAVEEDPGSDYLRLKLSDVLFQEEKFKDVIDILEPARSGTETIRTHLYLGLAYEYDGRMDEAIDAYQYIYRSEIATPEEIMHVGKILFAAGAYEDALPFYKKAAELQPAEAEIRSGIGEIYIALEQKDMAREAFEEAVKLDPDRIKTWLILAQLAESDENWEDALGYYMKSLGLAQHPAPILQNVLRISGRIGDFSRALELSRELVEKFPDDGPLWGMLGILYYQVGSLEEANDAIGMAIEKGADSFQLYLTLGRSLMELDKSDEAIENLNRAVALKPDEYLGWLNLSLAYFSLRKYDEALEDLDKVEALAPQNVQALYLRGLILGRQERFADAIEPLEKALTSSPENTDVLFSLAVSYERTDRREKAEELLGKILSINPEDSEALNYLGYMWAEKGKRLEEAEAMIVKALELSPDNGYYIDSIAWVYYQQGLYEKALQEMQRSVELVQDDPVVFEHLGDIYHELGRVDESREAWQKSLELDPDNESLKEKLGRE